MATVKMKWYGGEVSRNLARELRGRVHQAARMIANQLADNLGTPGPEPSSPGEFPHRQSGDLRDSVKVVYSGDSASVIVNAPHAVFVEQARPFFLRTHEEMRPELIHFMSQPLS